LLDVIEKDGLKKSKLSILQGLSKLRQIANHPSMVDNEYIGTSGKHEVLLEHIRTAIDEGHKVLVFSQFVSYLKLLELEIEKLNIPYFKLTGATSTDKRHKYD